VAHEGEEFWAAVTALALRQRFAGGHIEDGERGRSAVVYGIVRHRLDVVEPHQQQRLDAPKCLDLTLFIHAQHHGIIGRVEAEPDDVVHLLLEERVVGEIEVASAVRLHAEQIERRLARWT